MPVSMERENTMHTFKKSLLLSSFFVGVLFQFEVLGKIKIKHLNANPGTYRFEI